MLLFGKAEFCKLAFGNRTQVSPSIRRKNRPNGRYAIIKKVASDFDHNSPFLVNTTEA
jgi:hypothetical protein